MCIQLKNEITVHIPNKCIGKSFDNIAFPNYAGVANIPFQLYVFMPCSCHGSTFCVTTMYYIPLDVPQNPFNSLAPGRFQFNFRKVIFKLTLVNGGWGISYEIALKWMPQDLTDDKSKLVQVMAWCHQATSHYLSQCWPRSMSPYGVTRPQRVKWEIKIRKRNITSIIFRIIL